MKNAKRILILLITAVLARGALIPVGAKSVSTEVYGRPGKIVEVEFEFENIIAIECQFTFSNSDIFSNINCTGTKLSWTPYMSHNGKIAGFSPLTVDECTVILQLTVSANANPGDQCTIILNYETYENENSQDKVLGSDTVTVTIKEPLDTADLEQLIAKAELLDEEDYTSETWADLEEALNNAKKALSADTQQEVDDAYNALKTAIDSLVAVSKIDYSLLKLYISNAERLVESEYTAASWLVLENALDNARTALSSTSQQVVDIAAAELEAAINGLVKIPNLPAIDYSALRKQIKIAESLNSSDYTSASWSVLETALSKAYRALESDDQSVVDRATRDLKNAISDLVPVSGGAVNYGELNRQIAIAEGLNEADYTPASWSVLEAALAAAKSARSSKDQAVVDSAALALKNAIAALKRTDRAVDYTELKKQIDIALGLNENLYTDSSWENLLVYLNAAQSALNSNDQNEVDSAATALKTAIDNLVLMDYQRLLDAIARLKEHLDNDELANLWNQMYELLTRAEKLLKEGDQAAVDACAIEIEQLLVKIIEKLADLKDVTTVIVEKPVPSEPDGDYCNITSHRVWPILFWISLALNIILGGLIGVYLFLKRKKTSDDTPLVDYDIADDETEE